VVCLGPYLDVVAEGHVARANKSNERCGEQWGPGGVRSLDLYMHFKLDRTALPPTHGAWGIVGGPMPGGMGLLYIQ
jgi:hypothetical protein